MSTTTNHLTNGRPDTAPDPELREWVESFEALVEESGAERAAQILEQLRAHAHHKE
jgi:pyruvate dehydrogenase complex dehydrogenase (E1) component